MLVWEDSIIKHQTDGNFKSTGCSEVYLSNLESEAVVVNDECISNSKGFLPPHNDDSEDIFNVMVNLKELRAAEWL